MAGSLVISEIYRSIQGESTFAGLPCVFVRLTACNLRCSYCDTAYAFIGGQRWDIDQALECVRTEARDGGRLADGRRLPLVELTGGEPLLQPGSLELMRRLADDGFTVLLETSGALDISAVDPRVHRIVDLKCPGSGESERNLWANLAALRPADELKFVVGYQEDYVWMTRVLLEHTLWKRCPVLVSWAAPIGAAQRDPSLKPVPEGFHPLGRRELVEWLIRDRLPVRFQAQLHKVVWSPEARGV